MKRARQVRLDDVRRLGLVVQDGALSLNREDEIVQAMLVSEVS